MLNKTFLSLLLLSIIVCLNPTSFLAEEQPNNGDQLETERMAYYLKYEALTLIPWYYLAAIDQYEANIQKVRQDIPEKKGVISIHYPPEYWAGTINPNPNDTNPVSISFFNGAGQDGNGDGYADPADDDDLLFTMSHYLAGYGLSWEDFRIALWDYYKNEQTVKQIAAIAAIYAHFQTIDLPERAFPLPLFHNYSYRSTWGDRRGWGGRRIHEGTDIFASYGVPVRATNYGIIEIKGWNKFGGWRVGIRDHVNVYHYFAHLSGFNDEIKEGDVVEPGTIIGYVGSSGYGKPGTSGKFPPHLHYGMYKYNGRTEWAFDPYPSLKRWERNEKLNNKK